jgi:Tfp pilus assembly protein PilO
MGESTIATFLTGKRKRWLGLTWGLFLVGVLALPDVDRSRRQYRELGELRVKLAARAELPDRARTLAERVARMETEMADLEAALVPPDALSTFRQDITRMARGAGCRLRSIRPGPATRQGLDEALSTANNKANSATKKNEWEVEEQTSSISVQGTFGNLLQFLSTLENEARVLQLASLQLHSPPDKGEELVLELQVKTFNLFRARPG